VPNLRHDPDAAVVVTEVWQLFVSDGNAVDTAFVAFPTAFGAVDTAFGAWHGGHSLWTSAVGAVDTAFGPQLLEQWTQPLEPGTVDTAFGPQLWSRGHSLVEQCASAHLP